MKMPANYYSYESLPIGWKIICYQEAKKSGYKGNEIKKLTFKIEDGKVTAILDSNVLSDIFYT